MRDDIDLEVVGTASVLPGDREVVLVPVRGKGNVAVPAFATDPREHPAIPGRGLRRRIDRFAAVAYLAVSSSLARVAQLPSADRIGVFMANTRAGWEYGERGLSRLVADGPDAMLMYQSTAWFPAAAQGEVTIALGLRGAAKTAAGSASGFGEALWLARTALARGRVDLALVAAAESLVSSFVISGSTDRQRLTGPAEGAVALALRRASGATHVRLRGLRVEPGHDDETGPAWAPTLTRAAALHRAVTAAAERGAAAPVGLGDPYRIDVIPPRGGER